MRLSIGVLLCGLTFFQSGCGSWHRGFYESAAGPLSGWNRIESEGVSFFQPAGMRRRDGYVSFSTEKEGRVFMAVYFAGRSLDLSSRLVRVVAADGGVLREVPLSSSTVLEVPEVFTVEIPSFEIDGVATMPLHVHFAWTNRRYYRSVGAW